jgi:hypothetical protein
MAFITGLAVGYVLGTKAGRERYEQLRTSAQKVAANPAVRNAAESAGQTGREVAGKAIDAFSAKVGDRLPAGVSAKLHRVRANGNGPDDEWGGASNT